MTQKHIQRPQCVSQILADEHPAKSEQSEEYVFARIALSECFAAANSVSKRREAWTGHDISTLRQLSAVVVVGCGDRFCHTGHIVAPRNRMVAIFAVAMQGEDAG